MLLTGCDQASFSVVVCPTLREYDQKFLDEALEEYRKLPENSAIKVLIGDYETLRDQVRECRK